MRSIRALFNKRGARRLPPEIARKRLEEVVDMAYALSKINVVSTNDHYLTVKDWSLFTRYFITCIDNDCGDMRLDGGRINNILNFLARVNRRLEDERVGRVVIVGGFASELYSGGIYRTGDIDVIIDTKNPGRAMDIVNDELRNVNARREGRVWVSDYFGVLALDIVGVTYVGRTRVLRLDSDYVYVESPEDCIIESLNACVYWSSDADCERAAAVLMMQRNSIDWTYLIDRAGRESVLNKLDEIKRLIESKEHST